MSGYVSYQSIIKHLIEKEELFDLLLLLDDWIQYNNSNSELAIDFILENLDDLTDEFFDKFIEILDKHNKTEYALKCVRKKIETLKKERFEL